MRASAIAVLTCALLAQGTSCVARPRTGQTCEARIGDVSVSGTSPKSYFLDTYERYCDGEHTWEVAVRRDGEQAGVGIGNAFRGRSTLTGSISGRAYWIDSTVVVMPDTSLVVLRRDTLVRGIRIIYPPPGWRRQP